MLLPWLIIANKQQPKFPAIAKKRLEDVKNMQAQELLQKKPSQSRDNIPLHLQIKEEEKAENKKKSLRIRKNYLSVADSCDITGSTDSHGNIFHYSPIVVLRYLFPDIGIAESCDKSAHCRCVLVHYHRFAYITKRAQSQRKNHQHHNSRVCLCHFLAPVT